MVKRVVSAWFLSGLGLLSLILYIAAPTGNVGIHEVIVIFLATFGTGLGWSTWRATQKNPVGLAAGILGNLVMLGFVIAFIIKH